MSNMYNPKMVWVLNNNKTDHIDKFDGQPYKFPAGKRVKCHRVAANHFFACDALFAFQEAEKHPEHADVVRKTQDWWNQEKTRVLTRNRWNLDENGLRRKDGEAILAGFVIEPVIEATAQMADSSAA